MFFSNWNFENCSRCLKIDLPSLVYLTLHMYLKLKTLRIVPNRWLLFMWCFAIYKALLNWSHLTLKWAEGSPRQSPVHRSKVLVPRLDLLRVVNLISWIGGRALQLISLIWLFTNESTVTEPGFISSEERQGRPETPCRIHAANTWCRGLSNTRGFQKSRKRCTMRRTMHGFQTAYEPKWILNSIFPWTSWSALLI